MLRTLTLAAALLLAATAAAQTQVKTTGITDLAVTTAKINDNAVTTAKVALDTLTAADLAPDAVGASEMADNAVGTAEIIDGTVAAGDLATSLDLSGKTLTMPAGLGGWTYAAQTATTSGTTVELSAAIPDTAREIEILLVGASTGTANQPPLIQFGDSGGYETTTYVGITTVITGATANEDSHTDGFETARPGTYAAAETISGVLRMHRWDTAENVWIVTGQFTTDGATWSGVTGYKTTSAALDRVRLTTTGGAATFDAGEARVRYR